MLFFLKLTLWVLCLCVHLCIIYKHNAKGGQKRTSDLLELEFQGVVNCLVGTRY